MKLDLALFRHLLKNTNNFIQHFLAKANIIIKHYAKG